MVISRPEDFPEPSPGSFLHLGIPVRHRFFLRRPFSIFDCDERTITLLIVEKGAGTGVLRELPVGDSLDFLGPLGSSFPPFPGKRILAVAGGVGLAPLYYSRAKERAAHAQGAETKYGEYRLVYGARSKEDLFLERVDLATEDVSLATEDGSYGFRGTAVQLAERELERMPADVLFSCGPAPMLKAVSLLADERGIPHWVSLENRMACAMGACRSCVIPVRSVARNGRLHEGEIRYKTVCRDGPVFAADEIIWERLPEP
jgi:dihydroorotate dehydrogenase electron transfer subunit